MKPVYQSITAVDRDRGIVGDCFAACIASILELPLADVPHFAQLSLDHEVARGTPLAEAWKNGTDWWYMTNDWLAPRGLSYLEFTQAEDWHNDIRLRLGYHVIVGKSPRGDFDHCVVGRAGIVVHDPRDGARAPHLLTIKAYGLFIPADPSIVSDSECGDCGSRKVFALHCANCWGGYYRTAEVV